MLLPSAPPKPIGPDNKPLFGKYQGTLSSIRWDGVAGLGTRALKEKRWFYVSIANERTILAAAVIDVGWSMSGFAYLFDRGRGALRANLDAVGPPLLSGRVSSSPLGNARFAMP